MLGSHLPWPPMKLHMGQSPLRCCCCGCPDGADAALHLIAGCFATPCCPTQQCPHPPFSGFVRKSPPVLRGASLVCLRAVQLCTDANTLGYSLLINLKLCDFNSMKYPRDNLIMGSPRLEKPTKIPKPIPAHPYIPPCHSSEHPRDVTPILGSCAVLSALWRRDFSYIQADPPLAQHEAANLPFKPCYKQLPPLTIFEFRG